MTTLHAASAAATAKYYAEYLTAAPGEEPGVWSGHQAAGLGLAGCVDADALESLLAGRDPTTGTPLGRELLDRVTTDGRVVKAVSGFDATFSAPKSCRCGGRSRATTGSSKRTTSQSPQRWTT